PPAATRLRAGAGGSSMSAADAQALELLQHDSIPAGIGARIGGARVEDAADRNVQVRRRGARALLGESADAHQLPRRPRGDRLAERAITDLIDARSFLGRELVGRAIAPALLHEHQRAVVEHEELPEEALRALEPGFGEPPQARAADLAPGAREPEHRPLGVLAGGFADRRLDADEITHHGHVPEGDARLRHAEG